MLEGSISGIAREGVQKNDLHKGVEVRDQAEKMVGQFRGKPITQGPSLPELPC